MRTQTLKVALDAMEFLKDELAMFMYLAVTILCSAFTGCASLDMVYWDKSYVSVVQGSSVTVTCRSPSTDRHSRGLRLVHGDRLQAPLWDSRLQGPSNKRYRITHRASEHMSVVRLTIRDTQKEDSGKFGCILNSDDITATYMNLDVLEDAESRRKKDKHMFTPTTKTTTHLGIRNTGSTWNSSSTDGQSLSDMLGDFSEVLDKLKEQMTDFNSNNGRINKRPPKDIKDVNYPGTGQNDILLGLIPLPIIILVFLVALPRCTRNRRVWRGIPGAYDLSADMTRESVRNRQHSRGHRGCGLTHSPSCPNFIQATSTAQSQSPARQMPGNGQLCIQPPPYSEVPDVPVYMAAKYNQELLHIQLLGNVRESPPPYSSDYFNVDDAQEDVAVSLISGGRTDFAVPVSRPPSYTSLDLNVVSLELHPLPRQDEFS